MRSSIYVTYEMKRLRIVVPYDWWGSESLSLTYKMTRARNPCGLSIDEVRNVGSLKNYEFQYLRYLQNEDSESLYPTKFVII